MLAYSCVIHFNGTAATPIQATGKKKAAQEQVPSAAWLSV
jgi:hypothetical protein